MPPLVKSCALTCLLVNNLTALLVARPRDFPTQLAAKLTQKAARFLMFEIQLPLLDLRPYEIERLLGRH